ncbi:hypothetical protein [Brevibacillus laterosporus]|nr:hypothetical protein [Brevibacillus laterosporus]
MTDLNYTKQDAIKISAKKFKVTQKEIKKYVDLLGIESKRYIESKKTFLTKDNANFGHREQEVTQDINVS